MVFFRRPIRHMVGLRGDLDRIFDEVFGEREGEYEGVSSLHPHVNIEELKDRFVVTAELAGMKKEDVKITFQDGNLTISGEKKAEKEEKETNYHRYERRYGKFCRSFTIPNVVDQKKIDAAFRDGILTVTLPKAEEAKAREIEINIK